MRRVPDPIDFRQYTNFDIYKDSNAYYTSGPWRRTPRDGERDYLGRGHAIDGGATEPARAGARDTLASPEGSGDIWEAVFSPAGPDGYPRRIYDKRTGAIDHVTAQLLARPLRPRPHHAARLWSTLGPKLRGKIHIYAGLSDNWFLNDAVYLAEDFLNSATNPDGSGGRVRVRAARGALLHGGRGARQHDRRRHPSNQRTYPPRCPRTG